MDLVEDYLHAVALLLPKAQREDIVAELRDTILTRIEAREAERGRKLTSDEIEAVLREIGHPLLVAARYREGPQQLIGPALYPYWAFAVKVALTIVAAVAVITFVVRLLATGDMGFALGTGLASALGGAVTLVGVATIIAWIIERQGGSIGYLERWRVGDLKGLEFLAWDFETLREHLRGRPASASRVDPSVSRNAWSPATPGPRAHAPPSSTAGRALGAMAWGTVMVLWWVGLLPFGLVSSPGQVRELGFEPGPLAAVNWSAVRAMLFWPVLAYGLAVIAQGVVIWTRPRAVRLHGMVNLAIAAAVLACAAWMWMDSPLSPSLHVDSLAGLLLQLKAALRQPPPKPIAPFVALILGCVAFGALCRGLTGAFQLVFGCPWRSPAERASAAG